MHSALTAFLLFDLGLSSHELNRRLVCTGGGFLDIVLLQTRSVVEDCPVVTEGLHLLVKKISFVQHPADLEGVVAEGGPSLLLNSLEERTHSDEGINVFDVERGRQMPLPQALEVNEQSGNKVIEDD